LRFCRGMGPDGRGQMLIFFPAMRHKTSGIAHIPCPEGWAGMIVDHININLMNNQIRLFNFFFEYITFIYPSTS